MYKRLTNNNLEEYNPEYDFCVGCKHFGEPNGCNRPNGTCDNYERFIETYNRLAELEDKIENGTLIELPCKVGGRIYKIMKVAGVERIAEYVVMDFSCGIHGNFIKANSMQGNYKTITFREFCDCWFLTKSEAEKKFYGSEEV